MTAISQHILLLTNDAQANYTVEVASVDGLAIGALGYLTAIDTKPLEITIINITGLVITVEPTVRNLYTPASIVDFTLDKTSFLFIPAQQVTGPEISEPIRFEIGTDTSILLGAGTEGADQTVVGSVTPITDGILLSIINGTEVASVGVSGGNLVFTGFGTVTGAANVGAGNGIYKSTVSNVLQLKSLVAGSGIGMDITNPDQITLSAPTPSNMATTDTTQNITGVKTLSSAVVKGQEDVLTTYTPVDGATATIDYALGNAFILDLSALDDTDTITLLFSHVPAALDRMSVFTLIIKTGATVPTINWPVSCAPVFPTAAKENWYALTSINGGVTTRIFTSGSF
jgi:hypothetical protein